MLMHTAGRNCARRGRRPPPPGPGSGTTAPGPASCRPIASGRMRRLFTDNGNYLLPALALADLEASLGPLGAPVLIQLQRESNRGGMVLRLWLFLCLFLCLLVFVCGFLGGKLV